jgi:hypothetical protein
MIDNNLILAVINSFLKGSVPRKIMDVARKSIINNNCYFLYVTIFYIEPNHIFLVSLLFYRIV